MQNDPKQPRESCALEHEWRIIGLVVKGFPNLEMKLALFGQFIGDKAVPIGTTIRFYDPDY